MSIRVISECSRCHRSTTMYGPTGMCFPCYDSHRKAKVAQNRWCEFAKTVDKELNASTAPDGDHP
jgi:hypothetical protein